MSNIAIRVDKLGKRYHIGAAQERHNTLRDALVARFRRDSRPKSDETLWALKDVSFEVKCGEVVGVIGRNGAGKSTLLKILSRITEPTEGQAMLQGRIGSLLEVGTGFHPELTGRENIYLSGAILGMHRAEIDHKFDEIVAFAEIAKFLDTPVKRYSSGMYVRLAFAVAAHLDPEILLVDEVLAVGDAAFQTKCLGKMADVAQVGRTIIFVSHNMAAIRSLCSRCLLLESGHLVFEGLPHETVERYLGSGSQTGEMILGPETPRSGTGGAYYIGVRVLNSSGQVTHAIPLGDGCTIEMEFRADRFLQYPSFGIMLRNSLLQPVVLLNTRITHGEMPPASHGGLLRLHIDRLDLLPGSYYLSLGISILGEQVEWIDNILTVEIAPAPVYVTGMLPRPDLAVVYVPCHWTYDYD